MDSTKYKSLSDKVVDVINYSILLILAVVTLYPMLYVLFASVSNPVLFKMHQFVILLKPLGFQLDAYKLVFQNPMIVRGFLNTLIYMCGGVAISMAITFLGAYALSRKGYALKRFFTFAIMFTMYFSGGLVPTFLWVMQMGMLDTVWAILLPNALSTYNMIVMRTALAAIPPSLEESAKIDGANDFTVMVRIMLPLCIPTIAVVGLWYSVGRWNEWFNAVIYLRTRVLFPIQLILREILITGTAESMAASAASGSADDLTAVRELLKYAAIIITTVPILFIYPFIQKYFVQGMMLGSVKE